MSVVRYFVRSLFLYLFSSPVRGFLSFGSYFSMHVFVVVFLYVVLDFLISPVSS